MNQFKIIFILDLKNLLTNPMWWFYSTGLPLFLALIIGFLRNGAFGNEITAYDYYGITMMVFGGLNTATLAANCFLETRIRKANMRLVNAPIPSFFIHFSKVAASFVFSVLCHTLVGLLLLFFVGVHFGGANAIFLWLLLLSVDFFAASLSVMLCCLMKNEETVNQLLSNFVTIACLLGGAFFSMKGFGKVMDALRSLSPVTWINAAAFQTIYDNNLQLLAIVSLTLTAAAVLWILLSAKLFHGEDYL